MIYADRVDAGRRLAAELRGRGAGKDVIVYGLPRGGVPVAREVADALGAPLEALPVRKLGVPWYPELAMGAIAAGGGRVLLDRTVAELGVSRKQVDEVARREERELARRESVYLAGRPRADVRGKTALVVDDGLATGATMAAAVRSLRARGAARVVVACPVASEEARDWLSREADEVVCPQVPPAFAAVGQWYASFEPVEDAQVLRALGAPVTGRS